MTEASRFPGYRVLAKRDTLSWNEQTRRAIDERLRTPEHPRFFTAQEWAVAEALCRRVMPQAPDRPPVSLVALLDAKLLRDLGEGFREVDMPAMQDAWRCGLAALEVEAKNRHAGRSYRSLDDQDKDALIDSMQHGHLKGEHWCGMSAEKFFKQRVLVDVPALYYGHPNAWDEIGFGGPASPRGYVRLDGDRLDPWEAVEATPGGDRDDAEWMNRHVV